MPTGPKENIKPCEYELKSTIKKTIDVHIKYDVYINVEFDYYVESETKEIFSKIKDKMTGVFSHEKEKEDRQHHNHHQHQHQLGDVEIKKYRSIK